MALERHTAKHTTPPGRQSGLPPGIAKANAAAIRLERRLAMIVVLTPLLGLLTAIVLL